MEDLRDLVSKEKGRAEIIQGIDSLVDPEMFVDSGLSLRELKADDVMSTEKE